MSMIGRHLEKGCHVSMGYIHSKICWDLTLPHVEKLVLMALCWFTNEEGECFPSREQLALKTGLGVNHISKITKTLCEKGLLWKGSKGGVNTLYKVLIPDTHHYTTCSQVEPTPLHDMYTPHTPRVAPPTPRVDKPIYNLQEPTKEPIPPIPPTGADVDFFAPAVIEPLEAEVVQTVPAKRVKAKPQPVEIDPRFYALGEIMAEARQVCTGVQPRKSATKFYGEMFAKMVASDKADPKEIQTVVFWLLGGSKLAVEAFGFGLGNTPKKYEHAFSRNFASLYEKATRETRKPPQDPETPQMLDADEMLERLQSF